MDFGAIRLETADSTGVPSTLFGTVDPLLTRFKCGLTLWTSVLDHGTRLLALGSSSETTLSSLFRVQGGSTEFGLGPIASELLVSFGHWTT